MGNIQSLTRSNNGNKLKKVAGGVTTNYINGIQYNGNTIDFVQTSEGRVTNKTSFYDYSYNLTDHLGNTRVVVNKTGDLIQEDNYYPFGMEIPDPLKNISSSPKNKYLYNGKELQDEYGLNQYNYGVRFYDPVLGRWHTVDPLADKSYNLSYSPYNYVVNNPLIHVDPDGRDWFYYQSKGEKEKSWHWQEGEKATYVNKKGKEVTTSNGYDMLVKYTITGKNSEGAEVGKLEVFDQNKNVLTVTGAFTGNSNNSDTEPIPEGNYMMNLGQRWA